MALNCPFCFQEITPGITECPSCNHTYNSDTLRFINISQKVQEKHPHENRKQVRFPIKLRVVYSTPKAFADDYIFNLSFGGLFIETNNPLSSGEALDLKIFLPDKPAPMELCCEVMWSRKEEEVTPEGTLPPGMGMKFLSLSTEDKQRLINVLTRTKEGGVI